VDHGLLDNLEVAFTMQKSAKTVVKQSKNFSEARTPIN
jgi:hypothetical protein